MVLVSGGDRQVLREQLATATARLHALEAQLAEGRTRCPRTRLLVLDAFLEGAERSLRMAERLAQPVSAAVIDIDGFRELNTRRGAPAGDAALRELADRLRRLTRRSDVLGRSGADEFTVVMPGADLAGAQACCERLITELEHGDVPGAGFVTVSAGIALHHEGGTLGDLLAAANAGLDRARALGGARTAAALADGTRDANPAHAAVVEALATTLLERDRYTGEHSEEVVDLARRVALQLGLDDQQVEHIATAALLHDIGKVAIPDSILNKDGALTEPEWLLMREHPVIGERILRAIPGMGAIARIVRHEHERWDGAGYPDGLRGDAIPIGSRIILACDTYSAMTTDRPYRRRLSHHAAIAELARCAGTQFDPHVTEALVGCLYGLAQAGRRSA